MKKVLFIIFFSIIAFAQSQNVQLAYDYFRKGEFDKSAVIYKKLYLKNKHNTHYFKKLISCYQQQDKFDVAKKIIEQQQIELPRRYHLDVELGYNYQLQNQNEQAEIFYKKAINEVKKNPRAARLIGKAFRDNHMLDYSLQVYEMAMEKESKLNFNLFVASIYGERAEIDKMFNSYLNMVESNTSYVETIKRYVSRFITDDSQNENNKIFRKTLIKRLQNKPSDNWNNLLSWLYMQQKDYAKALIQEKAIYKRSSSDLKNIFELAGICLEDKNFTTAKNAFHFILENTNNQYEVLRAEQNLLAIGIETAETEKELMDVNTKFEALFTEYGKGSNTTNLQIVYADFLTFKMDQPDKAITVLKQASNVASSRFQRGEIKIKLADILVYTDKFNQALINYTQVQNDIRGSDIAQMARLKVAKTSYYKGDFDWAKTQLKVLKSATSKLISNDALKLNLLIGDNIAEDTIRIALKKYATADLLAFQNKNKKAIDTLSVLLNEFKGHAIEDEALYKQAKLFVKTKKYLLAENNYLKLIDIKKDGILVDDALYSLGDLYVNELNDTEKAKEMYQKIIFDFASSIYLIDARKKFRKLRGDIIE
jgi:hypothetical protein